MIDDHWWWYLWNEATIPMYLYQCSLPLHVGNDEFKVIDIAFKTKTQVLANQDWIVNNSFQIELRYILRADFIEEKLNFIYECINE